MRSYGPAGKSATAFRTISEVSSELDVPQHVLRFWETKFPQIRPLKRGGGRRYYRPEDVELLRRIQVLLYSQGYKIAGVQRLLKEGLAEDVVEEGEPLDSPMDDIPEERAPVPDDGAINVPIAMPEAPSAQPQTLPSAARRELILVLGELKALQTLLQNGSETAS